MQYKDLVVDNWYVSEELKNYDILREWRRFYLNLTKNHKLITYSMTHLYLSDFLFILHEYEDFHLSSAS